MADLTHVLHAKAIDLGRLAIRATTSAGSGHPTTALSLAHLVAVLMYRVMRWTPADADNPGSDRLVLSEGHPVPIIYAACTDLGVAFGPDGPARPPVADQCLRSGLADAPWRRRRTTGLTIGISRPTRPGGALIRCSVRAACFTNSCRT
jgi:transketolase